MGFLDFIRPQPPLVSLMAAPRPTARAALQAPGPVGQKVAIATSWVPPRRGSAELLRAYAELPWLHSIVKRRAEALASAADWLLWRVKTLKGRAQMRRLMRARTFKTPAHAAEHAELKTRALTALTDAGDIEPVFDDPLLDLLDRPWASTGSETAFWELTSKHQDLLGETFWNLERPAPGRQPDEILPIPPTWVTAVPARGGAPYFDVHIPWRGGIVKTASTDAIWVREHDPADPYAGRGVGTAGALKDELETDEYMAVTAKSKFYNRAIPEVLIGLLGSPTAGIPPPSTTEIKVVADDIEEKHKGSERAGQTHLVSGDFKAQQFGMTMVESQHVQGREFLRNTCMQIFGVPPEVLGVLDNANRSTIDAAAAHFATYSTLPQLERFRGALQLQLVPEFGTNLVLDYVSPVPTDKEYVKGFMVALAGAFKKNEIRKAAGFAPLPGPEGDELYKAPGAVPTPGEKPPATDAEGKPKAKPKKDEDADADA